VTTASEHEIRYEPFGENAPREPYSVYALLREVAPVYWASEAETWVVSRYEDVRWILNNPDIFSSRGTAGILSGMSSADALEAEGAPRLIILMDPPAHAELRSLVDRGFSASRVAELAPRIRSIVQSRIGELREAREFDLMRGLAEVLPIQVIAEVLGLEPERRAEFRRWTTTMISSISGSGRDSSGRGSDEAMADLLRCLEEVVQSREAEPRSDLVSLLAGSRDEEGGLSRAEAVLMILVLLVAGSETTTNLIGSMAFLLLSHPAQLRAVYEDRSLIPAAVEETLRYESPTQFLFRRATRKVRLHDVEIAAGDSVLVSLGSANRDPIVVPDPDRFDLRRPPGRHAAFGFGPHYCVGATLARLEARIALEELIEDLACCELCSPDYESLGSSLMRGPRRLRLRRTG
jgi:cytochrome P450